MSIRIRPKFCVVGSVVSKVLGGRLSGLVGREVFLLGVAVFAGLCCRCRCRIGTWLGRHGCICMRGYFVSWELVVSIGVLLLRDLCCR